MKIGDIDINNLGMILISFLIFTILFWMMSERKSKNITKCFVTIIGALPINKMFEAIITYFKK